MNEEYKIPSNKMELLDLNLVPLEKKIAYLENISKFDSSARAKCEIDLIIAYQEAIKGRH
jgi:hypothetical protein